MKALPVLQDRRKPCGHCAYAILTDALGCPWRHDQHECPGRVDAADVVKTRRRMSLIEVISWATATLASAATTIWLIAMR